MFGPIGAPELIILPMLFVTSVVPLVAGIWALFTLHRVRTGQDAMRAKLESIERLLHHA
jgi:hypothetical protein